MCAMSLSDAAHLVRDFYESADRPNVASAIDVNGVQAYMLTDKTLVIPGTNEFSDWYEFNFDLYDFGPDESHGFAVTSGDSGARYHAGFLEHARMVYAFAKPQRPKMIIGHSLGAASAQIVGSSLRVPTIAFASPRVTRQKNRIAGEGWVVNLCRSDDFVTQVPPAILGFRHIGSRYWLNPEGVHFSEDHRIDHYLEIMAESRIRTRIPEVWPPARA